MNDSRSNQSFSINNLLKSESPLSRKEAIIGIGKERTTDQNEYLLRLLKNKDEVFSNKVQILDTFCKVKSPDLLDKLTRFIEDEAPDPALEPIVYHTLETLLPLNASIIEKNLSSPPPRTLTFFITEAGRMRRTEAIPQIKSLLKTHHEDIGLLIPLLESFGYIGDKSACSTLTEFIKHPDQMVACTAIESLSKCCGDQVTQKLTDLLGEDEFINITIISSLKNIGGEEAIRAIAEFLSSDNPTLRNIAVDSLVALGEECIPYLIPNLSSDDPDIKINTLNVFCLLKSRKTLPHIVPLCRDAVTNIRVTALGVLELTGIPEDTSVVLDGILSEDTSVRQASFSVLENHPDKKILNAICEKGASDGKFLDSLSDSIVSLGAANIFLGIRHIEKIKNSVFKRFMQLRVEKLYDEFTTNLGKVAPKEVLKEFTDSVSVDRMFVNKFHILLVDDSRFVRKMISSQLQIMGFLVTTTEDGISAENLLEETDDIDILITDINMPVIDGVELIRRVKKNTNIKDLPIIVISTEGKEMSKVRLKEIGADSYIVKPINYSRLALRINGLIEQKKYEYKGTYYRDTRKHSRAEMDIPFFGTFSGGVAYGNVKNLSLSGMVASTNTLLTPDTNLQIKLKLIYSGATYDFKSTACVKWNKKGEKKGEDVAGFQFTTRDNKMIAVLEKFISEKSDRP